MTTAQAPYIRSDGTEKVTGDGRYTADLTLTGQAHAAFRYADHTHARILHIDVTSPTRRSRATAIKVLHIGQKINLTKTPIQACI